MTTGDGYTKLAIDDMESIWRGGFKRARASLGVTAFGLSVSDLPPDFDKVPAHVHTFDGQEEVYIVLRGSGWLEIAGERVPIDSSNAVRVGPDATRRPIAGPDGLSMVIVGATPGKPYRPFPNSIAGAPEANIPDLPGVQAAQEHESSADYTALRYDEMGPMTGYFAGVTMFPVRRSLGVTAFGINVLDIEYVPEIEDHTEHPFHDHADSNQEEVYVIAVGNGWLLAGDERVPLETGEMVRVAPDLKHRLLPDEGGLGVVAISSVIDGVYEPAS